MGITKSQEFSNKVNRLATVAKALGHPARIAILQLLAAKATCQCSDIVDELPLSQSTVSQHLKELKAAGLIEGEIEGARVCYCLNPKQWALAKKSLNTFFECYKPGQVCC